MPWLHLVWRPARALAAAATVRLALGRLVPFWQPRRIGIAAARIALKQARVAPTSANATLAAAAIGRKGGP
jgi:hypothetical protein